MNVIELRAQCLQQAGGDVLKAQQLYEWVTEGLSPAVLAVATGQTQPPLLPAHQQGKSK